MFNRLDGRTKSSLFPLEEINFAPYTQDEMKDIIKMMTENGFKDGVVNKEAIEFLANYTVSKNGDVRIVQKTLLKSGKLARNLGEKKVEKKHILSNINRTRYATTIGILNDLTKHEKFILKLIPKKGAYYPQFYKFYKSTDGSLGDRMLRNYMDKFHKLRLITMDKKMGKTYFITLNAPKDILFEGH